MSVPRYEESRIDARTNQDVDLVPREPIHERDNLQIEFIQRHVEIDHERVERVVVIRDPDIQVPFCGCATPLDPVRRG